MRGGSGVRDMQVEYHLQHLFAEYQCPFHRGVGQNQRKFLAAVTRRQVGRAPGDAVEGGRHFL